MIFNSEAERLVYEKIAPDYEKEGYEFIDPRSIRIPSGKWKYIPDFLARKGEEFVAIEVKTRHTRSAEKSLDTLKSIIEDNQNWKFVAFFADEEIERRPLKRTSPELIDTVLREVRGAGRNGYIKSAFLLAWGAFEASAREAHSRIFAKPQTPGRIITVLAERGELTPSDADRLRSLAALRNSLIHGHLDADINLSDVDFLVGAVAQLAE